MKNVILIFVLIYSFLQVNSQTTDVKYYKDVNRGKETSEKKAKFKLQISENADSIKTLIYLNVKTSDTVFVKVYKSDFPTGIWKEYGKDGTLIYMKDFTKVIYSDIILGGENNVSSGSDINVFETEILKNLVKNTMYPKLAKERGLTGKVYVQIKIDKDGKVHFVSIYKGVHPILDYEVYETINRLDKCTPFKKDGKPVEVYYIMPMNFTLY